ncbi:MAG: DNA alkylation repair protein [Muribaculaceae bacterium]|nr:DNA alkylation repair protein [Muribaculaceae bacterium]
MPSVSAQITARMEAMADATQAAHLSRFFQTAPGQYGYGDKFLGIRVPDTRAIVKELGRECTIADVDALTSSPWHELRLAGFLLLIGLFRKCRRDVIRKKEIVDYYLSILHRGNNWDLVDLVAPKILGEWVLAFPPERDILFRLADREGELWHQRVAVVSTWTLIRGGRTAEAVELCTRLLAHPHHLMHKATGWMLREVGKHGAMNELMAFLDTYAAVMPRTMLRYAIERLPEELRRHYLSVRRNVNICQ